MSLSATEKARGHFILNLLKAQYYEPQIQMRLSAYYCDFKWRKFLHHYVKGARVAYSHNDPKLFVRAEELFG